MTSFPRRWTFSLALIFAACLFPASLLAQEVRFETPELWALNHNLDPTVEVLNAIQRGADRAMAIAGRDAGPALEQSIVFSLHELEIAGRPEAASFQNRLAPGKGSTFVPQVSTRIDYVSPSIGDTTGGTTVYIAGKSFQPGASVTFGGVSATSVSYSSCNFLRAITPPGVVGAVNVRVTNPDATSATLTNGYTYSTPGSDGTTVTLTAISPTSGPATGGTSVTITGSGFTAPVSVYFVSATTGESQVVTAAVTSPTTMTLHTPPGAAGFAIVRAYGIALADTFFYMPPNAPPPTISAFDSAAIPGATIHIFGSNFIGVTDVRFAGRTSLYTSGYTSVAPTVLSSSHLTVTVPTYAVSGPIQVDTVFGTASPCDQFNVLTSGPPTITALPTAATWNSPISNYSFTIQGTNFQDVQDVQVNGLPVAYFSPINSTTIIASFAFLPPAGPVTVKTSGGIVTSAAPLNVVPPEFCAGPVPTITSLPPTGAPNSTISVGGTNFCPDLTTHGVGIRFAGERINASWYAPDNSSPINVTVPATTPGASPIALVTEWGYAISPTAFTPTAVGPPAISSLSASSGVRGSYVSITGTNLNGIFEFGYGLPASAFYGAVQPTSVSVVIPWSVPSGSRPIVLSSLTGSASAPFTVTCGAPTVTAIPAAGKTGTAIAINGSNLLRYPGRTMVFFNGIRSSATASNDQTLLTTTVPAGATAGPLTVVTGYGSATSTTFVPLGNTNSEFDGDGRADIFWHNIVSGQNYVYRMNGLSIMSQDYVNTVSDSAWTIAGTGDFNRDGKTDVLWRNTSTGVNYVYLMNGATITSSNTINTIADQNWKVAGIGDFDGDGRSDIFWRNSANGSNYIYFMNGTTITSQVFVNTTPVPQWQVVGIGDFNGDQKSDILWRNTSTGENYVYLMNGATIAGYGTLNTIPDQNWKVAGVGQFNNDGKADILWHNVVTGVNYIYYISGTRILQQDYVNSVPDLNWKIVSTADFNRDGITDILWRNSATGQNYIYLMNGSSIGANGIINTVTDPNWKVFE